MPEVFVDELRRQHVLAELTWRQAVASDDAPLAEAMYARLGDLARIAAREGVAL